MYIDTSGNTVNKCNNTYNRTIRMKPIDVTSSINIYFDVENNDKHFEFKFGHCARILKHKNIFVKGYTPN